MTLQIHVAVYQNMNDRIIFAPVQVAPCHKINSSISVGHKSKTYFRVNYRHVPKLRSCSET